MFCSFTQPKASKTVGEWQGFQVLDDLIRGEIYNLHTHGNMRKVRNGLENR